MTQAKTCHPAPMRNIDASLMSAIIDEVPLPIFLKDANSVFVLSNRRHAELVGKTESDLLGHTTAVLHGADEALKSRERDLPVLRAGENSVVQRDYAYASGQTCFLETRKTRLIDQDGHAYVLGVNIDLTDLHQKEGHLRSLTEAVPVGIVEITEAGDIVSANTLAVGFLSDQEVPGTLDHVKQRLSELGAGFPGDKKSYRLSTVPPGGFFQRHLVVSSTGWISFPHSTQRTALVSIADVSEIADLQRQNDEVTSLNTELSSALIELKQAQSELVKKGKLEQLGQLTATVAHELRNPLGTVRTSAFLLERKLKSDHPDLTKQFERISNGIKRCDDIITQLLDFTRTKSLNLKSDDLDGWLSKLIEEQSRQLPPQLLIECMLGLDGSNVAFDADRLSRAVINVVHNASEAIFDHATSTVDPARQACIEISTAFTRQGVEIRVKDNGPGIAPDVLVRIREPLFTTKNFGTGLGVPAVEKIMEQHNGGLDIASVVGEGTEAILWWPWQKSDPT
jgi:PAS domain S-box-containing protein